MFSLNERNLKNHIKTHAETRVFYLVGNDSFLIDSCKKTIAEMLGASIERFSISDYDSDKLQSAFYMTSFDISNRVILIDGVLPTRLSERDFVLLAELLSDVPDGLYPVLTAYYDDPRYSVSKKITDLLPDTAAVVSLSRMDGAKLYEAIRVFASREHTEIDGDAVAKLIELCGDDLRRLKNEVAKTAAFVGYSRITAKTVDLVVSDGVETNVYDMIRAIGDKNETVAFARLEEMLGERREPIAVCAVLINSFVNIYRAFVARENGLNVEEFRKAFGYKSTDKKIPIAYNQAAKYTKRKLHEIIDILWRLDTDLKSSRADHAIELECALAEIMR